VASNFPDSQHDERRDGAPEAANSKVNLCYNTLYIAGFRGTLKELEGELAVRHQVGAWSCNPGGAGGEAGVQVGESNAKGIELADVVRAMTEGGAEPRDKSAVDEEDGGGAGRAGVRVSRSVKEVDRRAPGGGT
jgi:hypothetical protein